MNSDSMIRYIQTGIVIATRQKQFAFPAFPVYLMGKANIQRKVKRMNDLGKTTITTLEIAEMMEVSHADILKKLEGRKDRKGYIQVLNEGQMSVVDYFIKSSYLDAKGEERPCCEVTKIGCDFLANKFTGEKGILFTAKYVKRFHDMENIIHQKVYETKATSLGEVASYTKEMDRRMEKQGSEPWKICEAFKMVSEQFGIVLPADFIKVPDYQQMQLVDYK